MCLMHLRDCALLCVLKWDGTCWWQASVFPFVKVPLSNVITVAYLLFQLRSIVTSIWACLIGFIPLSLMRGVCLCVYVLYHLKRNLRSHELRCRNQKLVQQLVTDPPNLSRDSRVSSRYVLGRCSRRLRKLWCCKCDVTRERVRYHCVSLLLWLGFALSIFRWRCTESFKMNGTVTVGCF
jgi:hypothetical protein